MTDTNLVWRKSSFSAENGACIELAWRTSSYSADNGHCVEVAGTLGAVRDSKNQAGPVLEVDLASFIAVIKSAG